jgi:phosphoribosylglycinamide formyltransferase-1
MKRLAVLISGRGTNFGAIHQGVASGAIAGEIAVVISNRPDAAGLERAKEWGYDARTIDHKKYANRDAHEEAVLRVLREMKIDFIALAGYMRTLTPRFVNAYRNRILNIHPSLLPAFPGVDAQAQAIAYGVKIAGCTVHLVDESLDGGPVLVQRSVEVRADDTEETLSERILIEEHKAYVEALQLLCSREYRVEGRRVVFVIPNEAQRSGAK